MITHGCVDGFSRAVIYLGMHSLVNICIHLTSIVNLLTNTKCYTIGLANNNKSSVVLKLFKEGVQQYMLPSRVRGDMGGENVQVADYMIHHRGMGRGSYLTGSSRFNTR